jgi:hypothetical protein
MLFQASGCRAIQVLSLIGEGRLAVAFEVSIGRFAGFFGVLRLVGLDQWAIQGSNLGPLPYQRGRRFAQMVKWCL